MKPVMLAVGLLAAVVAFASGATNLASLLWLHSTDRSYAVGAAHDVEVSNGCGTVTVREDITATQVTATSHSWSTYDTPSVHTAVADGVATVKGRCGGAFFGIGNGLSITVVVPRGTGVEAHSSGGSLHFENLTGSLVADTSAGSVTGSGLRSSTVSAHSSAGSVRMTFAAAPTQVDARSSAGSVTVEVPDDGTAYLVAADTSAGSTHVTVATDPDATRAIAAHSSAGSVTVRYTGG